MVKFLNLFTAMERSLESLGLQNLLDPLLYQLATACLAFDTTLILVSICGIQFMSSEIACCVGGGGQSKKEQKFADTIIREKYISFCGETKGNISRKS